MLCFTDHQGDTYQSHNEVPSYTLGAGTSQKEQKSSVLAQMLDGKLNC